MGAWGGAFADLSPSVWIAGVVAVICVVVLLLTRPRPSKGILSPDGLTPYPVGGRRGLYRVYFAADGERAARLSRDHLRVRLLADNPRDDGSWTSILARFERLLDEGELSVRIGTRRSHPGYFGPALSRLLADNPELGEQDRHNLRYGNVVLEIRLADALVGDPMVEFVVKHVVYALADLTLGSIHDTHLDVMRARRMFGASILPPPEAEDESE